MLRFEMGPFARETRRPLALWMAAWALPALGACGSSTHDSGPDGSAGSAIAGAGMSGGAMSGGGYGGMTRGGSAGDEASSGQSSEDGGRATGGAGGGNLGGGGAGGTGMGSGGSGTGGLPASGCPTTKPALGMCLPQTGSACSYDDCNGAGTLTIASCITQIPEIGNPYQVWSLETVACGEPVPCGGSSGQSCPAGQVCLVLQGGALITQCVEHSCGSGSIECDCVEGCYDGCTRSRDGMTYTCNTCADPRGCP